MTPDDTNAVRVPTTRCPVCKNPNDATTPGRGPKRLPKPDDYAVCFGCGAIMQFDTDLRCYIPEVEDVAANLMAQPDLAKWLLTMQQMIFAKNKRKAHH
jgi:hypothetical protein